MNVDLINKVMNFADQVRWEHFYRLNPTGLLFRFHQFWLFPNRPPCQEIYPELLAYGESIIPEYEGRHFEIRLTRYDVDDCCQRHRDLSSTPPPRKYSAIVQLNDHSEYEGGDLIIEDKVMPVVPGSTYVFESQTTWHEVTPVISGSRYSLVFWSF